MEVEKKKITNESKQKKPHANRIEGVYHGSKSLSFYHRVAIDTLNTPLVYATSVCCTAHLYSHKLLKCCIPFSLNKHKKIRQTHSQRDASMLCPIIIIITNPYLLMTKKKKMKKKKTKFKNKIVYLSDRRERERCGSLSKNLKNV